MYILSTNYIKILKIFLIFFFHLILIRYHVNRKTNRTFKWTIHLNSVVDVNQTLNFYDYSEEEKVVLQACTFTNIKNRHNPGIGGALYYNNSAGKLMISQTTILKCFAIQSSGAFHAHIDSYMFRYNCISQCFAGRTVMGFTISGLHPSRMNPDENHLHEINELSHVGIGPPKSDSEVSLTMFTCIDVMMKNSNISKSRRIINDCTIAAEFMDSITLESINFIGNKGPGLISFFHSQPGTLIKKSNFIRNNAARSPLFDITSEPNMTIDHCIFIENMFSKLIVAKEDTNLVFSFCSFDLNKRSIFREDKGYFFNNCSFESEGEYNIISMKSNDICNFDDNEPSKTQKPKISQNINQNYTLPIYYPVSLRIQHYILLIIAIIVAISSIYVYLIGSKVNYRITRKYL